MYKIMVEESTSENWWSWQLWKPPSYQYNWHIENILERRRNIIASNNIYLYISRPYSETHGGFFAVDCLTIDDEK